MSFNCDLSIGSRLAEVLPALSTVRNVALGVGFFLTLQHFKIGENSLTLAMDAIGDLFSSTKPEEIVFVPVEDLFVPVIQVAQVAQVSPTLIIKPTPTPALPEYLPESTSSVLYVVALCVTFILAGAVFTVLRSRLNKTPVARPIDPSTGGTKSKSKLPVNDSSKLDGGFPLHDFNKNVPRFLQKLKTFLILFIILTGFTHGGRITQQIRSLAIRSNSAFSSNNVTLAPDFREIPAVFTDGNAFVPQIMDVGIIIPSAIRQVKYNEIPTSHSSDFDEKYDSISLPLANSLSLVTGAPTTSKGPPRVAPDLAHEYIKVFILIFVFCTFIPILSFVLFVLPPVLQIVKVWKFILADQRETPAHAVDGQLMKFKVDSNEFVHAIEVVENNKVDINIIHDKVVPASKALEAIEEKDDETVSRPLRSEESLDTVTPPETQTRQSPRVYVRPSKRVRKANRAARRAEKAAIEAALNAPYA